MVRSKVIKGGTQGGGDFVPCPQGVHRGLCVDVVDRGWRETPWGMKPKVSLVWQTDAEMEDGRRFIVSKMYTRSLHAKAGLRQDIESWFAKDLSDERIEKKGFDLELLLGQMCQLNVVHEARMRGSEQVVFANVQALMPLAKGQEKMEFDGEYTRQEDREGYVPPSPSAFEDAAHEEAQPDKGGASYEDGSPVHSDDDIPF